MRIIRGGDDVKGVTRGAEGMDVRDGERERNGGREGGKLRKGRWGEGAKVCESERERA